MNAIATSPPEVTIIEDKPTQAKAYLKKLKLDKEVNTSTIGGLGQVKKLLKVKDVRRAFIVDINLGPDKEKEGIEIIKYIRRTDKTVPIIAYSGNATVQQEAEKAGAIFYLKRSKTFRVMWEGVRNQFYSYWGLYSLAHAEPSEVDENYFQKSKYTVTATDSENWLEKNEVESVVSSIDDEFVFLKCRIGPNKEVEKPFSLVPFKGITDFDVDSKIRITVKQAVGKILMEFQHNGTVRREDSDSEFQELLESKTFTPYKEESN